MLSCCRHSEPSKLWAPGDPESWQDFMGGNRSRRRSSNNLVNSLPGAEDNTMGRRSFGFDGFFAWAERLPATEAKLLELVVRHARSN